MGGKMSLFLVGGAGVLLIGATFAVGLYVGRASSPTAAPSGRAPVLVVNPPATPSRTLPSSDAGLPPSPSDVEPREKAPSLPAGARVEVPAGARSATGMLRMERGGALLRSPEARAATVVDLPRGATVAVRGVFGGFALGAWSELGDGFLFGWVAVPEGLLGERPGGALSGHVRFKGKPPAPAPNPKRKDADYCKERDVSDSAVSVKDGALSDVLVRLIGVEGVFQPPAEPAVIDQRDCLYLPRASGAMAGQRIRVRNMDGTLHNVRWLKGADLLFNWAHPPRAPPLDKDAPDEPGILQVKCDVHPWMEASVVVSDHPFYSAAGQDGAFRIAGIPAGHYEVEAWHPALGTKKGEVTVKVGEEAALDFTFEEARRR